MIKTNLYRPHKSPQRPDNLFPKVPVIVCNTAEEFYSQDLRDFCMHPKNPVSIIRGGCKAAGINLEYFTTRSMVKRSPNAPIEIRKQTVQSPEFNVNNGKVIWLCSSPREWKPLRTYALYQSRMFREKNAHDNPNIITYGEDLDFGTNLDLSDEKLWKAELQELEKLPYWLRYKHKKNLLSYVGQPVLGVNTVQAYIKVPGSRTPGHQENLCTCAVNINIGPGDTSWLSTPEEYWPALDELCKKNRVNYLEDPWWPAIEELIDAGIPVHRYIQRPGDIVFLNAGTPHWVQADGFCNNIAWNCLPMQKFHFDIAVERYELNLQRKFQSLVPMERVTWNLAAAGLELDFEMFASVRYFLQRSMFNLANHVKTIKLKGTRIIQQVDDQQLRFCEDCDCELYTLLWIRDDAASDEVSVPYCQNCAESKEIKNWVVVQQYTLRKLQTMYDKLKLKW